MAFVSQVLHSVLGIHLADKLGNSHQCLGGEPLEVKFSVDALQLLSASYFLLLQHTASQIPMQCGLCPIFELVQWPVYLLVIYISMLFLVSQGATRHHTQGQLRLFKGEVRSRWEGWESCGCNR